MNPYKENRTKYYSRCMVQNYISSFFSSEYLLCRLKISNFVIWRGFWHLHFIKINFSGIKYYLSSFWQNLKCHKKSKVKYITVGAYYTSVYSSRWSGFRIDEKSLKVHWYECYDTMVFRGSTNEDSLLGVPSSTYFSFEFQCSERWHTKEWAEEIAVLHAAKGTSIFYSQLVHFYQDFQLFWQGKNSKVKVIRLKKKFQWKRRTTWL